MSKTSFITSCKLCKYTGDPVGRRLYVLVKRTNWKFIYYRGHQGIEDADSEGCAASEGLSEVQLSVRVIVIILVQELDIGVIDQLSDHRHIGAVCRALPLIHDGGVKRGEQVHTRLWPKEEVIIVHDGEPVPLVNRADGVVKCHGLDVKGGEDGLLVRHSGVIVGRNLGRQKVSFII